MKQSTEILWNNFSSYLLRFILKNISDVHAAEDILQNVFIKIHSKIDTLKDEAKIKSWIFSITRNAITDYIRSTGCACEVSTYSPEEFEKPDKAQNFENTPAHEMADGLREIILSLPEKYSQALILTELEGMSQKELAEKLSISVSGAKSRVQRAKLLLKENLMKCCHFEFDKHGTITDIYPACCCCRK
ncbi:MAG TPA: RNA polymerase sigma factor SigZ [Spirochaetota bacterium]|nr:RNA polymerase sigma factor SigZ [Spirochaetota bacterium]